MTTRKWFDLTELSGAVIHDTLENTYYEVCSLTSKYLIAEERDGSETERFPLFGSNGINSGRYVVLD